MTDVLFLQQPRPRQLSQSFTTPRCTAAHQNNTVVSISTAPTLAEQKPIQPSGSLDDQDLPPPRAPKRRLSLRSRQDSFPRHRSPLHLERSAKSSSAVPTVTDLAVGRSPVKGSTSSSKTWLSTASSAMPSSQSNASPAVDLLRQTMIHK